MSASFAAADAALATITLALARPERTPEAVEAARGPRSGYLQLTFGLDAALVRLDMPELAIAPLRQVSSLTASVRVKVSAIRLLTDA